MTIEKRRISLCVFHACGHDPIIASRCQMDFRVLSGRIDEQPSLGVGEPRLKGHQAAVRASRRFLSSIYCNHSHARDDRRQGRNRSIARIDAAKHHQAPFADAQYGGIVIAPRKAPLAPPSILVFISSSRSSGYSYSCCWPAPPG